MENPKPVGHEWARHLRTYSRVVWECQKCGAVVSTVDDLEPPPIETSEWVKTCDEEVLKKIINH